MRPSAHNLELQTPSTALWVQRFASERLHRAAPLPTPGLTIGQTGRTAGEFAQARMTGQVGIGLRTREFFERMIARWGRGRRGFLHRGDMRLVMKRRRPFHFSGSVAGPPLTPAAQSFLSRARVAAPPWESITHKTIYSFVTLTLPFRAWTTTHLPASEQRRLLPPKTLPASQPGPTLFVPVSVSGQGPWRENRVQIAPKFALAFTQIFRTKPVSSGESFKSETRFWQNHAPFMESMPLSRPPVPQASWIGVSPSAPPPAERWPSWISTAAVTLPLSPPVVAISSPVTLPRPAFVMLPEMVYGTRAFITRPVFVTPSAMGRPEQDPSPTTPSRRGFAASSAHTPGEIASPRKSLFQLATRLLAATAALSLVQTLPALRLAAASAASNPSMASFASLTSQRTPLVVQHPRAAVGSSPLPRLRFHSSTPERPLPSRRTPMWPQVSQTAFLSASRPTISPVISWDPAPNLRMGVQIAAAQARRQDWPVRTASTKVDFASVLLRIHAPGLILLHPAEFTRKSGQKSDSPAQLPRILRAARKPKRTAALPLPIRSKGAVAEDIPRITPLLKHLDRLPFPRIGVERLPISESGKQASFFSANLFTKRRGVPPLALTRGVSEPEGVFLPSWSLPEGDAAPAFESITPNVPRQRLWLPVQVSTPIIPPLRSGTSEIVAGPAFAGKPFAGPAFEVPVFAVPAFAGKPFAVPVFAGKPFAVPAFAVPAFSTEAINTAGKKAQNQPSSIGIKALVRAGGPGEIVAANLMAQSPEQINRDLEETVAEEFQPQLLTVVQNFLREVWNALSFARAGLEAVPAVPDSRSILAGAIGQSAIIGTDTPPSAPHLRLIRMPTRQSFLREAPSPLIVGRQSDSVFAARMLPTAWPSAARNIPAAQRFPENTGRDLVERDLAERGLSERGLSERGLSDAEEAPKRRMGLPGLWPLPPTSRLPEGSRTHFPLGMTIAEARQTIAARREALTARSAPSSIGRGSTPTISPSPVRPLPMTLPAAAMTLPVAAISPPSEEIWAIQRSASGEQSAAATLPEAHQQDVNLASQEKGAAANDVHLMANEVWSLLKRRLETEAERIGRR
jgi:hypothetical protein